MPAKINFSGISMFKGTFSTHRRWYVGNRFENNILRFYVKRNKSSVHKHAPVICDCKMRTANGINDTYKNEEIRIIKRVLITENLFEWVDFFTA